MNPLDWIGGLLGKLPEAVGNYFNEKQKLASAEKIREIELKDALHRRQVELIAQGLAADATWELEQIRNSGWKDEYVLIVLSIPLIGCFVPGLAPYVLRGFEILSQTPSWYQWLIGVIFTAVYGVRIWRRQQSDT
jgi:hypothetical protein